MSKASSLLLFLPLFLLFSPLLAHCQDFPMLHYTMEDGLPSKTIYQVYRDSKGYLWIATDKGVARYNGIKFDVFTSFDGLPDNEIFYFKEDYYGRLWLATYNGELCYYKDGVFHTAANTPFLNLPYKSPFIISIVLEKDSSLTFSYTDHRILLSISNEDKKIYNLDQVNNKDLNIYSTIFKRKISKDAYEFISADDVSIIDTAYHVKSITKKKSNGLPAFGYAQDQVYFFEQDSVFSEYMRPVRPLLKGFFDKNYIHAGYSYDNNFFLATANGLFINDTLQLLKNNSVSTITNDDNGNYWVGTLDNGLYCFKKDLTTRIYKNCYPGVVKYCFSDSGHIFFSTADNNLFCFENTTPHCIFNYRDYKKCDFIHPNEEVHLIDDHSNYYCIYGNDLIVINKIFSKKLSPHIYNFHFQRNGIKSIFSIGSHLYVKTRTNILCINKNELDTSVTVKYYYVQDSSLENRIFGIGEDQHQTIWYSTLNKIFRLQNDNITPQPQFGNLAFKSFGIFGKYLLGYTHNNKLVVCNNIDGAISIDSIPDQNCIWDKIYKLNANQVLISTNNFYRLITLYPSEGKPKYSIFTIESPFVPLEAEAVCADSSYCYFFINGSITTIDFKDLFTKPDPVKLYFTSLNTGHATYPIGRQMQIPFLDSKNITISFSTLSFSGNKVFYQYSVSKNNIDNWRALNSEEINLFNLGYGTYAIKIRGKSISSDYCQPIQFTLLILRPFWATWWFAILSVCIAGCFLWTLIRYRILFLLRKNEKENELKLQSVKAEYKALNALMNPHFIFNTLNNVQSLVNDNNKIAANEYLRVFADLIRQNMHNISKELIPLQKEIDLVTNYLLLEKLRFEDQVTYEINIDDNIDPSDILIPPLLIQPLVENSIKHGILNLNNVIGLICINIYQREGYLYIEVKDNGVGMANSGNKKTFGHESFGLDNIRTRIKQLSIIQNKEITFDIREEKNEKDQMPWTIVVISMLFIE